MRVYSALRVLAFAALGVVIVACKRASTDDLDPSKGPPCERAKKCCRAFEKATGQTCDEGFDLDSASETTCRQTLVGYRKLLEASKKPPLPECK